VNYQLGLENKGIEENQNVCRHVKSHSIGELLPSKLIESAVNQ